MTNQRSGHLAEERIQSLLDGRLPAEERAAVEYHLERCTRCRTKHEAWKSVFARLEEIPELSPSPGFAEGVMDALPGRTPFGARVREWIRGLLPVRRPLRGHPGPELVLDHLDEALSGRRRARVETHLEGCAACRREVDGWRQLLEELDGLERFAPPEGFAESVLSRIQLSDAATAPAGPPERSAGWIERLRPRSRKGWALAGGAAAAPAAAMAIGALTLFSNPLLTPVSLGTFLWWRVSGAAGTVVGSGIQSLMESPLLFQLWKAVQAVAESPTLAGAGALAFSAVTLGAVWVLYRNLISTPPVERGYANVPS